MSQSPTFWYVTLRNQYMHPHTCTKFIYFILVDVKKYSKYGQDKLRYKVKVIFTSPQGYSDLLLVCDTWQSIHVPTYPIYLPYIPRTKFTKGQSGNQRPILESTPIPCGGLISVIEDCTDFGV